MVDNNKMIQQMFSVFSIFMVMFYIGMGAFLVFFIEQSVIDKAAMIIIGSVFMVYGVFRAFKTFFQIKELFFNTETDDDE